MELRPRDQIAAGSHLVVSERSSSLSRVRRAFDSL